MPPALTTVNWRQSLPWKGNTTVMQKCSSSDKNFKGKKKNNPSRFDYLISSNLADKTLQRCAFFKGELILLSSKNASLSFV